MTMISANGVQLHVQSQGPQDAPALVMAHGLGCDLHLWDAVLPHLPQQLRVITYDLRGHGTSDHPEGPYSMGALVRDAETLIEALGLREVAFLGLSLGGLIAQGLAAKRLDLVRVLILSNTAPKIGTRQIWQDRIALLEEQGLAALAPNMAERWFTRAFRAENLHQPFMARVLASDPKGYAAAAAAIAGADFLTPTAALRLPVLAIAGAEDGSTPPDLMREMADMIPGARFALMRKSGHLPPIDSPAEYAALIGDFLRQTGHIAG